MEKTGKEFVVGRWPLQSGQYLECTEVSCTSKGGEHISERVVLHICARCQHPELGIKTMGNYAFEQAMPSTYY